MKVLNYFPTLIFILLLFSCDVNNSLDDINVESRSVTSNEIYDSQSFQNLMNLISLDNEFINRFFDNSNTEDRENYFNSYSAYTDALNDPINNGISLEQSKNLASVIFNQNFDNYIDQVTAGYSAFFNDHSLLFKDESSNHVQNLIEEAVEMYLNEYISDSPIEIFTRNPCNRCYADYNHCIQNAQGSWAINQVGVFTTGAGIGLASIWTGPGAIGSSLVYSFGASMANGFNYVSSTWVCSNDRDYCLRNNNCIGGGSEENGPIPFGN